MADVAVQGTDEADAIVRRAAAAFPAWRAVAAADRARLLRRFAVLVEEHAEELALLETRNVGKPITDSRGEVAMVADVLHFYAGAVDKHRGATIPVSGGLDLTVHEPLGVVLAIVPWNFPLAIASWKVGPALACGNTVVVKPAQLTPLTALRFAELALAAGIPEGVLQVVVGPGSTVGSFLVEHPAVAKVAFTGSTEAGRDVMARASGTIKRVTLELGRQIGQRGLRRCRSRAGGGQCPVGRLRQRRSGLLRPQPDPGRTRRPSTVSSTSSSPPPTPSSSAIPKRPATEMGPLVSEGHRADVASFLEPTPMFRPSCTAAPNGPDPDGGSPPRWWPRPSPGRGCGATRSSVRWWRSPRSTTRSTPWRWPTTPRSVCRVRSGPRDGARALRMARAVNAGVLSVNSNTSVRVNTPFGGMKQSGFGRELGLEALDAYSDVKNIFLSTDR